MKQLVLPMLTDNPILSHTMATCTIYESGFLIDKMDELPCIPILVSFGLHIDRSWVVNIGDCIEQCVRYFNNLTKAPSHLSDLLDYLYELPLDGILVVFRMKTYIIGNKHTKKTGTGSSTSTSVDNDDDDSEGMMEALQALFLDSENDEFRASFLKQTEPTSTSGTSGKTRNTAATPTNPVANALPSSINSTTSNLCKYMALFFSTATEANATVSILNTNQSQSKNTTKNNSPNDTTNTNTTTGTS